MNVALFGAGRIGKIHAANLARQPGMSLKYVVDISPDATAELARQYGAQAAVSESVLGDSSVKAVVIASSTDTHADLIMRSATAGKAIFFMSAGQCMAHAPAAKSSVATATMMRFIGSSPGN